jgi:nucleoside phosphorylase
MKKLFVFATELEAHATIHKLHASQIAPTIYQSSSGNIIITGMGPHNAYKTLCKHIDSADIIYNLGIVGALKEQFSIGEACSIKTVSFDQQSIDCEDTGHHLLTVRKPLHDPAIRDKLAQHYDFVDMEGFFIAKLCQERNKSCKLLKVVSDFCGPDTTKKILERISDLSQAL